MLRINISLATTIKSVDLVTFIEAYKKVLPSTIFDARNRKNFACHDGKRIDKKKLNKVHCISNSFAAAASMCFLPSYALDFAPWRLCTIQGES